jgi:hypothetical protein
LLKIKSKHKKKKFAGELPDTTDELPDNSNELPDNPNELPKNSSVLPEKPNEHCDY